MARLGWGLLAASLVANLWLWRRAPPTAAATPTVVAVSRAAEPAPARALWPSLPARGEAPVVAPDKAPSAPSLTKLAEVGPDEEQAARCAVAEREQVERWQRDRQATADSLRRSLADSAGLAEDTRRESNHFGDLLGLDGGNRERFAERYAPLRQARMDAARAALASDPPEWEKLSAAARGLFGDEDELARSFGGDSGRQGVRAALLDGRSTILALLVALGGRTCDDATCDW